MQKFSKFIPQGFSMPPTGWVLAALLVFYICAGLFYHDPWKTDDAVNIGVVYDLLVEGVWANLQLAGRPWGEAPLYYWVAALNAQLFSSILPLHAAIRSSNIIWMAIALIAIYYASRESFGRIHAAAAPLLLVASLGLVIDAHMANPALVLMAVSSCVMLSSVLLPRKAVFAALILFAAVVVLLFSTSTVHILPLTVFAALAHIVANWQKPATAALLLVAGELAPNPNQKALLPLPLLGNRHWQNMRFFIPIVLIAIIFSLILYSLLQILEAQALLNYVNNEKMMWINLQFFQKLWLDNILRLPWFAWPAFPLLLWTLWAYRQQILQADILNPLLFVVIYIIYFIGIAAQNEREQIVVLLPAIALLATPAALSLRPGAANALDWFNKLFISSAIILVWLGWMAMNWQIPAFAAKYFQRHSQGFVADISWWSIVFAVIQTFFWLWLMLTMKRSAYRAITIWCGGLTCLWLLLVTLWLPWIDYGKSYREVSYQLAEQVGKTFYKSNDKKRLQKNSSKSMIDKQLSIPNGENNPTTDDRQHWQQSTLSQGRANCVSEQAVGDAQLASFAYFTGLQLESLGKSNCRWLIIQGKNSSELRAPNDNWQYIWEGARKNDSQERFRLYQWKY